MVSWKFAWMVGCGSATFQQVKREMVTEVVRAA